MIRLLRCFLREKDGSLTVEAMLTLPLLLITLFLCVGLVYSIHGMLVLDQAAADACRELAESSYLVGQAWGAGIGAVMDHAQIGELTQAALASGAAEQMGGYLLAANCLQKHLKEYPAIAGSVSWDRVRLPLRSEENDQPDTGGALPDTGEGLPDTGEGLLGAGEGLLGVADVADASLNGFASGDQRYELYPDGLRYDEDDVLLVLQFTPAKISRMTSLLPSSWHVTIVKRERAWMTGRNALPERGKEQAAGKDAGPLVYITNWGEKYHVDGCRYLRKSQIPAYLNELATWYGGCSVCKPPPRQ